MQHIEYFLYFQRTIQLQDDLNIAVIFDGLGTLVK